MAERIGVVGLLLGALLLGACDESNEGANGAPCLKNRDCASNRCVATICQPMPSFEGESAGSGGGGDGGQGGEATQE